MKLPSIDDKRSARSTENPMHASAQTVTAAEGAPSAAQQPLSQGYALAPGEATLQELIGGSLAAAPATPSTTAHAPSLAELLATTGQGSDIGYDDDDATAAAPDAVAAPLAQPLSNLQSDRKFAAAFGRASQLAHHLDTS
jgi:hypothetical protein